MKLLKDSCLTYEIWLYFRLLYLNGEIQPKSKNPFNCYNNKNAFQWDVYRPLVDRGCIPACTAWGVSAQGGCMSGARVSAPGRCLSGCVCPEGAADTHTPLWTEWQTRVKTLPFRKLRLRAVIMFLFVPILTTMISPAFYVDCMWKMQSIISSNSNHSYQFAKIWYRLQLCHHLQCPHKYFP